MALYNNKGALLKSKLWGAFLIKDINDIQFIFKIEFSKFAVHAKGTRITKDKVLKGTIFVLFDEKDIKKLIFGKTLGEWTRQLKSEKASKRAEAALMLGDYPHNDRLAIPELMKLLDDKDANLRLGAA